MNYFIQTMKYKAVIIVFIMITLAFISTPDNLISTNSFLNSFAAHQAISLQATIFTVAAAWAAIFQGHLSYWADNQARLTSEGEYSEKELERSRKALAKAEELGNTIPQAIFLLAALIGVTFVTAIAHGFDYGTILIAGCPLEGAQIKVVSLYIIVSASYLFFYVVLDLAIAQLRITKQIVRT